MSICTFNWRSQKSQQWIISGHQDLKKAPLDSQERELTNFNIKSRVPSPPPEFSLEKLSRDSRENFPRIPRKTELININKYYDLIFPKIYIIKYRNNQSSIIWYLKCFFSSYSYNFLLWIIFKINIFKFNILIPMLIC